MSVQITQSLDGGASVARAVEEFSNARTATDARRMRIILSLPCRLAGKTSTSQILAKPPNGSEKTQQVLKPGVVKRTLLARAPFTERSRPQNLICVACCHES